MPVFDIWGGQVLNNSYWPTVSLYSILHTPTHTLHSCPFIKHRCDAGFFFLFPTSRSQCQWPELSQSEALEPDLSESTDSLEHVSLMVITVTTFHQSVVVTQSRRGNYFLAGCNFQESLLVALHTALTRWWAIPLWFGGGSIVPSANMLIINQLIISSIKQTVKSNMGAVVVEQAARLFVKLLLTKWQCRLFCAIRCPLPLRAALPVWSRGSVGRVWRTADRRGSSRAASRPEAAAGWPAPHF